MRESRTYGSMRRGGKRVMVHSANGHRTRKGGHSGAPPDLDTTALAPHSTQRRELYRYRAPTENSPRPPLRGSSAYLERVEPLLGMTVDFFFSPPRPAGAGY